MKRRRVNALILTGLLSFCFVIIGLTYGVGLLIPCPFKALTGVPCPGCGGMRALDALLHGHLFEALVINPLSVLLIVGVSTLCLWIGIDLLRGTSTCIHTLRRLDRPGIIWSIVVLLIIAWGRNIAAGI